MNPVLSPAELHWHISFNMVAEVWIEHTTSRLWALRATTALLRDMFLWTISCLTSRLWALWCSLDYTPQNGTCDIFGSWGDLKVICPSCELDCSTPRYVSLDYFLPHLKVMSLMMLASYTPQNGTCDIFGSWGDLKVICPSCELDCSTPR